MTTVFLVLLMVLLVAGFCGFLVWRIRRCEGRQAPRLQPIASRRLPAVSDADPDVVWSLDELLAEVWRRPVDDAGEVQP